MCIITAIEGGRLYLDPDTDSDCDRYEFMIISLGISNFLVFAVSAFSLIAVEAG
jgi:hypothetical protein